MDAEGWLCFFGFGTMRGTQASASHPVWGTHGAEKNGVPPWAMAELNWIQSWYKRLIVLFSCRVEQLWVPQSCPVLTALTLSPSILLLFWHFCRYSCTIQVFFLKHLWKESCVVERNHVCRSLIAGGWTLLNTGQTNRGGPHKFLCLLVELERGG